MSHSFTRLRKPRALSERLTNRLKRMGENVPRLSDRNRRIKDREGTDHSLLLQPEAIQHAVICGNIHATVRHRQSAEVIETRDLIAA
jgi:hypothetical protein